MQLKHLFILRLISRMHGQDTFTSQITVYINKKELSININVDVLYSVCKYIPNQIVT